MSHHLTSAMSRSRDADLARAAERRRLRSERDELRAPALPSSLWARLTGRRAAPIAAPAVVAAPASDVAPASPAATVADALAVPVEAIIVAAQDAVEATVEVVAPETAEGASA